MENEGKIIEFSSSYLIFEIIVKNYGEKTLIVDRFLKISNGECNDEPWWWSRSLFRCVKRLATDDEILAESYSPDCCLRSHASLPIALSAQRCSLSSSTGNISATLKIFRYTTIIQRSFKVLIGSYFIDDNEQCWP